MIRMNSARRAWLAGLKEGDEIAVLDGSESEYVVGIYPIAWINDRGIGWGDRHSQISDVKRSNGRITSRYGYCVIAPVTDEHRAIVRDRQTLTRLHRQRWDALTPDQGYGSDP